VSSSEILKIPELQSDSWYVAVASRDTGTPSNTTTVPRAPSELLQAPYVTLQPLTPGTDCRHVDAAQNTAINGRGMFADGSGMGASAFAPGSPKLTKPSAEIIMALNTPPKNGNECVSWITELIRFVPTNATSVARIGRSMCAMDTRSHT
jgi:hypothetical protein